MESYISKPLAIKITVSSHNFLVSNLTFRSQELVKEFCVKLTNIEKRWVRKRLITTEKEKYFLEIRPKVYEPSMFRFHRHILKNFLTFLKTKGYSLENERIYIKEVPVVEPVKVEFNWTSDKTDLDYQVPVIEFCLSKKEEDQKFLSTKAISMQTGKGKTYCSFRIMKELSARTWIMVLPKYLQRWVGDIKGTFHFDDDQLLIIDSTTKLIRFLEEPVDDRIQVVILTTSTWATYIKDWVSNGISTYPIPPDEFNSHLKAGLRIIDELHEYFHTNFCCDLATNIKMTLSLSATLDPKNNDFKDTMMKLMVPFGARICPEYDRYIDVIAYAYRIAGAEKKIKYRGFAGMYNHVKFEQSILKRPSLKKDYFRFIYNMLFDTYLKRKKKGHRALLLFHQTDMCEAFYHYLSKRITDQTICFYHGKSEVRYEDLDNYEIIISTKSSCGTAVDIPMLLTTVMPACEESNTGNEQALGRTRKLRDGTTPNFVYTFCKDVDPQVNYHRSKIEYFRPLAKSQKVIDHNIILDQS